MVVLESEVMLTAGSNQYLQPDYLSPVSTTLDTKKSPLALLAQTCSQIGADSSKPLPADKKKDEDKKEKVSPAPAEPPRRSPAFKPYESCTPRKEEPEEPPQPQPRPASSQASARPSSTTSNGAAATTTHKEDGRRSSEASTSSSSATPIIRSGLEVLAGHPKDVPLGTYRTVSSPFLPPGYPPFETHPAFRGAPTGLIHPGFSIPTLASLSAYPGFYPSMMGSPYVSYTRVKTGGGGETVVPVCRDPYCTGCPYSLQNNHLLQSMGACPPSCTQCEQAKAALSAVPGLASVPPSSLVPASSLLPPTSASAASLYTSSLFSSAIQPRGLTCNWMAGADSYCGKRFTTAEELLQHLRSHTSAAVTESSPLSMLSNPLHAHAMLLNSAAAHSALHRPSFSPPALSPLAARYHPYGKPHAALTPSLSSLPPYPPTALTSAGYPPGYPSPYASLYPRPGL